MKRLACFLLEGLVEQGPHRVWVTLGAFETQEAAQRAKGLDGSLSVVDTRVIALYRDSGVTTALTRRAHTGAEALTDTAAGYTVA